MAASSPLTNDSALKSCARCREHRRSEPRAVANGIGWLTRLTQAAQPLSRCGVEGIMGSTRGSTLRNWRTVSLALILAAASAIAAVVLTRVKETHHLSRSESTPCVGRYTNYYGEGA